MSETNDLPSRVAVLEQIARSTEAGLLRIENRLDRMDARFERMDARLDRMDGRIDTRFDTLTNNQRGDFRWLLGIMLAGFTGLLGVMAHGFHWL